MTITDQTLKDQENRLNQQYTSQVNPRDKTRDKNPYEPGTPEWQLQENIVSNESAALAWDADAQRYAEKAAKARRYAELYRAALRKLAS